MYGESWIDLKFDDNKLAPGAKVLGEVREREKTDERQLILCTIKPEMMIYVRDIPCPFGHSRRSSLSSFV